MRRQMIDIGQGFAILGGCIVRRWRKRCSGVDGVSNGGCCVFQETPASSGRDAHVQWIMRSFGLGWGFGTPGFDTMGIKTSSFVVEYEISFTSNSRLFTCPPKFLPHSSLGRFEHFGEYSLRPMYPTLPSSFGEIPSNYHPLPVVQNIFQPLYEFSVAYKCEITDPPHSLLFPFSKHNFRPLPTSGDCLLPVSTHFRFLPGSCHQVLCV